MVNTGFSAFDETVKNATLPRIGNDTFDREPALKNLSSSSSAFDTTIGSVAWGEQTKGVLKGQEKEQLIENFKFVFSQERLDEERVRLGLLRPKFISIDDLVPPDTRMVKEALAYAREVQEPALMHHCWRTYYFGAMVALHDGIDFDRELGFTAAILHDLGLISSNPKPCDCCFAVTGGIHARDFLLNKGFSREHADTVAHAIAAHLNYHVPFEEHGPEAFLVARGAVCDVFGTGVSRMSPDSIKEVLYRHSRDGLYAVLNGTAAAHLADT